MEPADGNLEGLNFQSPAYSPILDVLQDANQIDGMLEIKHYIKAFYQIFTILILNTPFVKHR